VKGSAYYLGSYYLNTLIANNKVPDSDKWDGYQFADYLDQAVKTTSNIQHAAAVFTGTVTFPAINGGLQSAGTTGLSIYDNEINAKNNGALYLGNRNTSQFYMCVPLYFGSYYLNTLVANNKVCDSDKWNGQDLPALQSLKWLRVTEAGNDLEWHTPNLDALSDVHLNKYKEAAEYDVLTKGADNEWCAYTIEGVIAKWPFKSYEHKWECWTAAPPSPWTYGVIGTGSAAGYPTIELNHPGIMCSRSNGANSGYYWECPTIFLGGNEQIDFVFKTPPSCRYRKWRLGWMNSSDTTSPTDGLYFEMDGSWSPYTNIRGVAVKDGTATTTSWYSSLLTDTWYRGRIVTSSDMSSVIFHIYAMDGSQLDSWSAITTNIPSSTDEVFVCATGWYTDTTEWEFILILDLIHMICSRGLTRG